jgi:hypothetical protein
MRRHLIPTLLALLALVACREPDFDPPELVTKPRILGIVATPAPERAFNEPVTLEAALAFEEQITDIQWLACPFSLGAMAAYACTTEEIPIGQGDTVATYTAMDPALMLSMAGDDLPAFGDELLGFLRQTLEQNDDCLRAVILDYDACAADRDEAACDAEGWEGFMACMKSEGVETAIHLVITLDDGSARDGYKRVLYRDFPEGVLPNQNPAFQSVTIGEETLIGGETLTLTPGEEIEIVPALVEGAVETYRTDEGEEAEEIVYFSWYATDGSFDRHRTLAEKPENKLSLPEAEAWDAPLVVWIMLRDDRLGAAFLTFTIEPVGGLAETGEGGTP